MYDILPLNEGQLNQKGIKYNQNLLIFKGTPGKKSSSTHFNFDNPHT